MKSPNGLQMREDARSAERYFAGLVADYLAAYRGKSHGIRQRIVNRLFRAKSWRERTDTITDLLQRYDVKGKRVLDLGCGPGRVSMAAEQLGATVIGLDIVEGMVQVARSEADSRMVAGRVSFRLQDITQSYDETADNTLLLGVIEYYRDVAGILARAAAATRDVLIIQDTNGSWLRRRLRLAMARAKGFHLSYRDPDSVARIMSGLGFVEGQRIIGATFTVMVFRKGAPCLTSKSVA
jgi:SAM-dependent methyltransferase